MYREWLVTPNTCSAMFTGCVKQPERQSPPLHTNYVQTLMPQAWVILTGRPPNDVCITKPYSMSNTFKSGAAVLATELYHGKELLQIVKNNQLGDTWAIGVVNSEANRLCITSNPKRLYTVTCSLFLNIISSAATQPCSTLCFYPPPHNSTIPLISLAASD